jgi:hypothetical protein
MLQGHSTYTSFRSSRSKIALTCADTGNFVAGGFNKKSQNLLGSTGIVSMPVPSRLFAIWRSFPMSLSVQQIDDQLRSSIAVPTPVKLCIRRHRPINKITTIKPSAYVTIIADQPP